MVLAHGQSISSEEVERVISREFSPQKFASMCNAISWATRGIRCESFPSFTERTNVKDGGIDVEWFVELTSPDGLTSPLLGSGWNVFQYKQRDMFASGRENTFSTVKSGLKGALRDLYNRTNYRPDRYVLFINLDLTHFTKAENASNPQKSELKEAILEDYDSPDTVRIEIIGAAELSSLLDNYPHIRSAFFATSCFRTWQEGLVSHENQKPFGKGVGFIGRESYLKTIETLLNNPDIRSIIFIGPHNVGKTRLAFETTTKQHYDTIVSIDPHSLSVSDLLSAQTEDQEVTIIIEDPEYSKVEELINCSLSNNKIKLLITLPTSDRVSLPNFGLDSRVKIIRIEGLSASDSEKLLLSTGKNFDWNLNSWLIELSGGNPGILLFSLGNQFPANIDGLTQFAEAVGKKFEEKMRQDNGEIAIKILRLLSLFIKIGIKGGAKTEFEKTCNFFDPEIKAQDFTRLLPILEKAGVVKIEDDFAEVVPPFFANHLADLLLSENTYELLPFFSSLNPAGQSRLVGRFRFLRNDSVLNMCNVLSSPEGPLIDFQFVLGNLHLLFLLNEVLPIFTITLIESGLKALSLNQRQAIRHQRPALIQILEELLRKKETSVSAVRCLILLAEAENEPMNHANNATNTLCRCFYPLHPQIHLTIGQRLSLLDEIFKTENSLERRLIGIEAIEAAVEELGIMLIFPSRGNVPYNSPALANYGEQWNYFDSLIQRLLDIIKTEDSQLVNAAREKLPNILSNYSCKGIKTVEFFQIVTDWILANSEPIPVAPFVLALQIALEKFEEIKEKVNGDAEKTESVNQYILQVEGMIEKFNKASYDIRLKRWAGDYHSHEGLEEVEDEEDDILFRYDKELRDLAREAVLHPELLSAELLKWFGSKEAVKAPIFFHWLGKYDAEKKFQQIVQRLRVFWGNAFENYSLGQRSNEMN